MPTLRDLGERELIRHLIAATDTGPGTGILVGPGDDAAVVRVTPGAGLALTTDSFVEGRHWRPRWITSAALGARLAEANLSDLAATAARPRWALLSFGLRPDHELEDLVELERGAAQALASHGATIVGGNIVAVDRAEWASLTIAGETGPKPWTRSGARPGDRIAVTGVPGRSGAALRLAARDGSLDRVPASLAEAWRAPRAEVALALALAETGHVHAAIDVSDGLAGDLAQVATDSGVGVLLELEALPSHPDLERAAKELGLTVEALRLGPSDDYELVLAVAAGAEDAVDAIARELGVTLSFAGTFTEETGMLAATDAKGAMWRLEEISAPAFDHFDV